MSLIEQSGFEIVLKWHTESVKTLRFFFFLQYSKRINDFHNVILASTGRLALMRYSTLSQSKIWSSNIFTWYSKPIKRQQQSLLLCCDDSSASTSTTQMLPHGTPGIRQVVRIIHHGCMWPRLSHGCSRRKRRDILESIRLILWSFEVLPSGGTNIRWFRSRQHSKQK